MAKLKTVKRLRINEEVAKSEFSSRANFGTALFSGLRRNTAYSTRSTMLLNWNQGKSLPSVNVVYCMSQLLGCSMEDLIEDNE